jgi:hypothetical protein
LVSERSSPRYAAGAWVRTGFSRPPPASGQNPLKMAGITKHSCCVPRASAATGHKEKVLDGGQCASSEARLDHRRLIHVNGGFCMA